MEYARKMILVPESSIKQDQYLAKKNSHIVDCDAKQSRDNTLKSVQTPGTVCSRLDNEMSEILNSTDKNEHDKWLLYCQALQRYLHFIDNNNVLKSTLEEEKNKNIVEKVETVEAKIEPHAKNEFEDSRLIESVPNTYRWKAQHLLSRLHEAGKQQISWNDKGTVSINGNLIDGSNIIDLVNDAMRARKSYEAIGRQAFAQLIHHLKVPNEFIGNKYFKRRGASPEASSKRKISTVVRRLNSTQSTPKSENDEQIDNEDEEEEELDEEKYDSADDLNATIAQNTQVFETPKNKKIKLWSNLKLSKK